MGLFGNLFKSEFEKWVEGASHEELSEAYEDERQQWIKDGFNGGTGEKTAKMNRLNEEINKRVEDFVTKKRVSHPLKRVSQSAKYVSYLNFCENANCFN